MQKYWTKGGRLFSSLARIPRDTAVKSGRDQLNRGAFAILLSTALFVGACTQYTYNGTTYRTLEEALAAQDTNCREILDQIPRDPSPQFGSLAIVLPDETLVRTRGTPKAVRRSDPNYITETDRNYRASVFSREYQYMAHYVEKRNLFESVSILESDDPEFAAKRALRTKDAILFLFFPDQATGAWILRRSNGRAGVPVNVDYSIPAGFPRVMAWLKAIQEKMEPVE